MESSVLLADPSSMCHRVSRDGQQIHPLAMQCTHIHLIPSFTNSRRVFACGVPGLQPQIVSSADRALLSAELLDARTTAVRLPSGQRCSARSGLRPFLPVSDFMDCILCWCLATAVRHVMLTKFCLNQLVSGPGSERMTSRREGGEQLGASRLRNGAAGVRGGRQWWSGRRENSGRREK